MCRARATCSSPAGSRTACRRIATSSSHHVIPSTIIVTTRGSPTNAQPRAHTKAHESRIGRHATKRLSPDRSTTPSSEPSPDPKTRGLSPYELATSGVALEDHAEISRYTLIFGHLSAVALTPDQSRSLISDLAESLR